MLFFGDSLKILVNGLCDSAGKTTTVRGLNSYFSDLGEVNLFKPFAANNYWFDHSIVSETLENGEIYGDDTEKLIELTDGTPRVMNPIHRLWAPATICGRDDNIGNENESVLFDRVWNLDEGMVMLKNSNVDIPENLERLFSESDKNLEFSDVEELNEYMESIHLQAVENSWEELEECNIFITESYSDVAMPIVADFDVVVTVEPGRAYISDGERFTKAHKVVSERWNKYGHEISTGKVLDMLKPEEFGLEPFSSKEEAKDVYKPLFEGLRENYDF